MVVHSFVEEPVEDTGAREEGAAAAESFGFSPVAVSAGLSQPASARAVSKAREHVIFIVISIFGDAFHTMKVCKGSQKRRGSPAGCSSCMNKGEEKCSKFVLALLVK